MIYGSICSGIEAATVAWHGLGWRPAFFAEIAPFPSAVLAHYYPEIPNHGDFTQIGREGGPDAGPLDLLVGGTPCQSFSIAGKRLGLNDPRGNLALEYLALARRLGARWLLWENVAGVLSSNRGRDFGTFLGFLGECGYGWAYRVLDAQYFGVPQRRRRVFVVGYLGDWRRAAAVLFERESLRGDPPPRRQAGQGIAAPITAGSPHGSGYRNDPDTSENLIVSGGNNASGSIEVAAALNAHGGSHGRGDFESETFIAHTLSAEGFDASEDGTGRGTPLVPIAFSCKDYGADAGDLAPTMRAMGHAGSHPNADGQLAVADRLSVRRLTPRECERLQGFPDDYTFIPWRNRLAADGPRYKALGNSMAVPVMRWIGERIQAVEELGL